MTHTVVRPIEVLLVENNPVDVRLTIETMREGRFINNLSLASDGEEALEILRRQGAYAKAARPDLILMDLKLPRKDGRQLLAEIKADPALRQIPVILLTTASAEDVLATYNMPATCVITKPVELAHLITAVRSISEFWSAVSLASEQGVLVFRDAA